MCLRRTKNKEQRQIEIRLKQPSGTCGGFLLPEFHLRKVRAPKYKEKDKKKLEIRIPTFNHKKGDIPIAQSALVETYKNLKIGDNKDWRRKKLRYKVLHNSKHKQISLILSKSSKFNILAAIIL